MKRYRLLAFAVVALMLLSALPLQQVYAQTPYSEKLSVYVAGSDALWYLSFGGINGTAHLSALESTPGISWYNISAIDSAGWLSDFQVFGPSGYNLTGRVLGLPYVPSQGMFFTVGADTFAHASAAAAAVDSYLLTDFVSMNNASGVFSFYSPVSFASLMPATLLRLLPTSAGGFASVIATSSWLSSSSPFVILEGNATSSGFSHRLVVGSISNSALTSAGVPNILAYFGSSPTFLEASNKSSSSTVQIVTLAGSISATGAVSVANDAASHFGSYSLSLSPGERIFVLNATVAEQPAPLLATRAVDAGVLNSGGDLAVTLTFRDLSSSTAVTGLTFSDNWWNSTSGFTYLGGNYSVTNSTISPGQTITPVYRLKFSGSSTGQVTIPASTVNYQYKLGKATFNATATLNPIRLSLNQADAVVYAIVVPSGPLGKAVGTPQSLTLKLVNVGTLPASSVVAAGQSVAGLAADGGAANVTVTQNASGLTGVFVAKGYGVTYQDPSGTALNATSNVFTDYFSQTSMQIGFPQMTSGIDLNQLSNGEMNVTLTFAVSDFSPVKVENFTATLDVPPSLGCGKAMNNATSCSGDVITVGFPAISPSTTVRSSMAYNLTEGLNFVLPPAQFASVAAGTGITGYSNPVAVAAGLRIEKLYAPAQLFGGTSTLVTVMAANNGAAPLFNASVKASADAFDVVSNSPSLVQTARSIPSSGNLTFSYRVTTSQVYGNLTGTPVTATFYYGGTQFTLNSPAPHVYVSPPLSVTVTSSPTTPEEGKPFKILVQIINPSGLRVSDVNFTLPLPSGITLSDLQGAQATSGDMIVYVGSLAPHGSASANATAVASSGISVPFSGAKLTFVYGGSTVNGVVPANSGIVISENVLLRYIIPTGFILLVTLGVAFYLRRMATAPASQK